MLVRWVISGENVGIVQTPTKEVSIGLVRVTISTPSKNDRGHMEHQREDFETNMVDIKFE